MAKITVQLRKFDGSPFVDVEGTAWKHDKLPGVQFAIHRTVHSIGYGACSLRASKTAWSLTEVSTGAGVFVDYDGLTQKKFAQRVTDHFSKQKDDFFDNLKAQVAEIIANGGVPRQVKRLRAYPGFELRFLTLFSARLHPFWDRLIGFDVVKFDDLFLKSGDHAMVDVVRSQYGDEAVKLIQELIAA